MIINIFLYLLGIGCISAFYKDLRFQKILSILFMLAGALGLNWLLQNIKQIPNDNYSYPWLNFKYYRVNLDFFTNSETLSLFLPFCIIAVLTVFYILCDKQEKQKLPLCALSALNLAALILIICGQNTLQILIGVCFVDVLGFYVINNISAKRPYIFYNLLADMALFMSFAVLWGGCTSNLLSELSSCRYINHASIWWLILLVACLKMGLFPFQGYFMPSMVLSESRRNILSFISTPVVGFLILYKTQLLFPLDFTLGKIITGIAVFSIVWGLIGALLHKNLEQKKLYLNIIFYGLACSQLGTGSFLPQNLGLLFILHFFINNSMRYTNRYFGWIFVVALLLMSGVILNCEADLQGRFIPLYLGAVILIVGGLVSELPRANKEDNSFEGIFISYLGIFFILYLNHDVSTEFYYWLGVYSILVLLRLYRFLYPVYNWESLQTADGLSKLFYFCFVSPIQLLGRILWLTIDFLIIERTLLNSLSKFSRILSDGFVWLFEARTRNTLIFLLLSLGVILGCYYWDKW